MFAYLDHNATTPPAPEVVDAMTSMLRDDWGNPSSVHRFGQKARQRIELAREQVAKLLNCAPKELIFTSGATESNNLALRGLLEARAPRKTLITTKLEHSAARQPAKDLEEHGYNVVWLPVSIDGLVDLAALEAALKQPDDVALVSIHWINNETGAIQPIEAIGRLCRAARVPFFTDATQAIGKVPADLAALPVDALSFSGHKMHAAKGSGALFLRNRVKLVPQQLGGPHERDRRAGTENTAGIVGLGVAAELAIKALATPAVAERGRAQRDRLERAILAACEGAVVNSAGAPRLWNTTNIGFPTLESEAILILLSERGLFAAAGAACSSGSLEPSPVLLAQGIAPPIAHGSVRFSLCRYTTDAEIDYAIQTIPAAIATLKASMPVS
jgi:cysteine desulfurase